MTAATTTTLGEIVLSGDLTGTGAYPELRASGVTPGTYGPVSKWYVDAKGRTTSIATMTPAELADAVANASYVQRGVLRTGYNINNTSATISVNTATSSTRGVFTVQSPLVSSSGTVTLDYSALPVASTTTKGIIQVGSGLSVTSGVLSVSGTADATTTSKGLVQIGTNLSVASGVLSTAFGDATSAALGVVSIAAPLQISAGVVSMPVASESVKGIVKPGSGFAVSSGILSANISTTSNLGVVKIGSDFENTPGLLSLPISNATKFGLVQIGSGLSVTSGVVDAATPDAGYTTKGVVQPGSGFDIVGGVISYTPPYASTTVAGVMMPGTNISISAGTISATIPDASTSSKGLVQVGSGLSISAGTLSLTALPDATTTGKGLVSPSATDPFISLVDGVLSVNLVDATSSSKGVVQIASNGGLSVSGGVLSSQLATSTLKGIARAGSGLTQTGNQIGYTPTDATTSTKGVAQFSSTFFSVTSGVVSLNYATSSSFGVIQPADTTTLSVVSGGLDVGTNIPKLNTANTFSKAQVSALVSDAYTATYSPDFSVSNTFEMSLTGNISLANPTNVVAGGVYTLVLNQDGVGGRTITLSGSAYKTNRTLALTTRPNGLDVITLICKSSTEIYVIPAASF